MNKSNHFWIHLGFEVAMSKLTQFLDCSKKQKSVSFELKFMSSGPKAYVLAYTMDMTLKKPNDLEPLAH